MSILHRLALVWRPVEASTGPPQMPPNGVLSRLRSFEGYCSFWEAYRSSQMLVIVNDSGSAALDPQMPPNGVLSRLRSFEAASLRSSQMLVIVNDSGSHWGTGSLSILHRLALVWRPVEASTGPQMPPNGVLSRLRSFEGYCNFWEAYRSSQMLVIVNDSGSHWGTGSLSILHRLALVWRPVEASTGPQMPPNGVLSRLRSFEGYCNFWEAYRSSQMLVIVNDSGSHWGTGSLSILHRLALVWRPVEASTGPQMPPNGVLSRLRSFEGYCSFWEAYRSSQMLVIVNDSGSHWGTGSLSILHRLALVWRPVEASTGPQMPPNGVLSRLRSFGGYCSFWEAYRSSQMLVIVNDSGSHWGTGSLSILHRLALVWRPVEASTGPQMPPNGVLSRLRSFEGYCSFWEAYRSSQMLVIVNDSGSHWGTGSLSILHRLALVWRPVEASTGPQMPPNGVLSRLRSFGGYCSFWEAYRSSQMLVIVNDSGSHWGTGSLSILHRLALVWRPVEASTGPQMPPNGVLSRLRSFEGYCSFWEAYRSSQMLVIVNDSGSHWGTGSLSILHRLALVWRPVEASTGPQMPPNGVLSRLRSFEGYCSFWEAYRSSQMLVIVNDSGSHWGTGSLSILHRLALVWRPVEASTGPQMPPNGVLSRLRSFEGYCSFWEAYRSSQMLVIVNDSGSHWGTGSLSILHRLALVWRPVEASTGPQMPPNGVLSRLRSFEGYCSFWEAYRSSQMLVIVNDSGSHWGTGSLSILHRLALVWRPVEASTGPQMPPNGVLSRLRSFEGYCSFWEAYRSSQMLVIVNDSGSHWGTGSLSILHRLALVWRPVEASTGPQMPPNGVLSRLRSFGGYCSFWEAYRSSQMLVIVNDSGSHWGTGSLSILHRLALVWRPVEASTGPQMPPNGVLSRLRSFEGYCSFWEAYRSSQMLVIVNDSNDWGTGSLSILHTLEGTGVFESLALVWRPVEASTGPQMPPNGVLSRLRSFEGYCSFWEAYRSSQMLVIVNDSGSHWGTGSLSILHRLALVWRPVEASTGPQMPPNGVLSRLRSFEGYCSFWEAYRSSQMLVIVNDSGSHWGTGSLSILHRLALVWRPVEASTGPQMPPNGVLSRLRSFEGYCSFWEAYRSSQMLVIVNDSGSHWGTGSLSILHRLALVWRPVEASTGPQMPPNGVLSRLRSFGGYCSFWEAYRSSQMLVIVNDSGSHWGTGSLSILHRLALVWRPVEASTGPQMPPNGVLSRLRSFEGYCSFWEAYRSSQMLVIVNDSGSHWGTGSLSILHRLALVWRPVEASTGPQMPPNGVLSRLRSFEGYCSFWEAYRSSQMLVIVNDSGSHWGTGSLSILHRLALVWRPVEASTGPQMPPNGVLSRLRSFGGYCSFWEAYRSSQMLVIVNDSGSHWGTGSLSILHRLALVWRPVEASTGPQMPPNGVLSRLRSFEGYCSFWEAYRSSQMLVIVNDSGCTVSH